MECYHYLQDVQNLLANAKSQIWTKIWWIIQRTNYTFWRIGWKFPKTQREMKHEFINLKEIIMMIFGYALLTVWIWEEDILIIDIEKSKKRGSMKQGISASRNTFQKTECERSPDNPKRWRICISCGRWFSKITKEKLRIPRTHSETGIHREDRESQRRISWRLGRVSTWRNERWRRNQIRIFGLTQKLGKTFKLIQRFRLSSSYWTETFNYTCREKNHILFHWITLLSWAQLMQIWRLHKEAKSVRVMDWI